jgi:hypothetical protein
MRDAANFWNGLAVAVAAIGMLLLAAALFLPAAIADKGPLAAFGGFAFFLAYAFREKSQQAAE